LGIDADRAKALGLTTYKIAQTFPLDMQGLREWADGLDLIVVVEEKRKLIEVQVKEAIFENRAEAAGLRRNATGRGASYSRCAWRLIRSKLQ